MVGSNGKNQGVKCQLMTFFTFKPALDVRLQFAQIFPLYYFVNLPSVTNTKTSISTHLSLSLSLLSAVRTQESFGAVKMFWTLIPREITGVPHSANF